jgi:hypothetical protein
VSWTFWGLWRQYKPDRADLPPTIFLTNGEIDWYDLAHGRLEADGHYVPKEGWWIVVDTKSRRVTDTEPAARLQFCAPLGRPEAELWWTDEEPLEYPYRGDEGWILLEVGEGGKPTMRRVPYEEG